MLQLTTPNTVYNNHLPILTQHTDALDQQNHSRHRVALHAFRQYCLPLILQIVLFSILHVESLIIFRLILFCAVDACIAEPPS